MALHSALEDQGIESPFARFIAREQETPVEKQRNQGQVSWNDVTTQVPSGDFFEYRTKALRAHATQVDPDGFFFAVSEDLQREVWPWEDFVLVESKVHSEIPEHDLFAGIGSVPGE